MSKKPEIEQYTLRFLTRETAEELYKQGRDMTTWFHNNHHKLGDLYNSANYLIGWLLPKGIRLPRKSIKEKLIDDLFSSDNINTSTGFDHTNINKIIQQHTSTPLSNDIGVSAHENHDNPPIVKSVKSRYTSQSKATSKAINFLKDTLG